MLTSNLAPVIVFVYNRAEHVEKMITQLSACYFAQDTNLYIYSDGARKETDIAGVNAVRLFCENITGFKSVNIVKREKNYGLAQNIILGVSEVISKHGKIIVMEDDLIAHKDFLFYMNTCLEKFKDNKKIWHISGWNYPVSFDGLPDILPIRLMNCWGWATWADRWSSFEKDPAKLVKNFNKNMIKEFDIDNSGYFWSQVLGNNSGKLNTWAIFWYAAIFLNNGLCINPKISLVTNIGHDGSGTHKSKADNVYTIDLPKERIYHWNFVLEEDVIENAQAISRIEKFYKDLKPSIFQRVIGKIKRVLS